jgi:hypothetical protein
MYQYGLKLKSKQTRRSLLSNNHIIIWSNMKKNMYPYWTKVQHLMMMNQQGSKFVVININVNNFYYYFYLNCCVDRYKYTVLNDTQQDATRKNRRIKWRIDERSHQILLWWAESRYRTASIYNEHSQSRILWRVAHGIKIWNQKTPCNAVNKRSSVT